MNIKNKTSEGSNRKVSFPDYLICNLPFTWMKELSYLGTLVDFDKKESVKIPCLSG